MVFSVMGKGWSVLAIGVMAAAVGMGAGSARGVMIGVQFLDEDTGYGNNPANGTTVGVPGYTQSVWNGVPVHDHNASSSSDWASASVPLVDSSGASSSIFLAYSSQGSHVTQTYYTYPQAGLTATEKFLSGGLIGFGDGADIGFENVPAGSYSLMIYVPNAYPGVASFSVNGGPATQVYEQYGQTFSTSGDVYATHPGVTDSGSPSNYLLLTGVTPNASGLIDLHEAEVSGTDVSISAVQLISEAPEPASLGLMGVGVLALWGRRRR